MDDVITSIDGHTVGDDYTVLLRGEELISADYLVTGKQVGEPTTLGLQRRGRPLTFTAVLAPLVPPLRRSHGFDCSPVRQVQS